MAHLSPPPSPPNTLPASVTSKLLNYPNIMNGLEKLNFPLATSALRANLNTALQNKFNQGKIHQIITFFSDSIFRHEPKNEILHEVVRLVHPFDSFRFDTRTDPIRNSKEFAFYENLELVSSIRCVQPMMKRSISSGFCFCCNKHSVCCELYRIEFHWHFHLVTFSFFIVGLFNTLDTFPVLWMAAIFRNNKPHLRQHSVFNIHIFHS